MCARGACPTWSSGPSTSPLGVPQIAVPQKIAIRSPWLRAILAAFAAFLISIVGFILLAFVIPAVVMGAMVPWADRPVGSAMYFLLTVPPVGLISLIALCVLTRVFYVRLSGVGPPNNRWRGP